MIVYFHGNLGEGKTIGAISSVYEYVVNSGKTFYANCHIDLDKVVPLERISQFRDLSNCGVLIDDIISWLDNRRSNTNVNVTWEFLQSRHNEINPIIYTAQIPSTDNRIRWITNMVIETKIIEFPFFQWRVSTNEGFLFETVVEFSKQVSDLYDTYESIYQHVRIRDLIRLFDDCYREKDLIFIVLLIMWLHFGLIHIW